MLIYCIVKYIWRMLSNLGLDVDLQLMTKIVLSFSAGSLIGLERERAKSSSPGVRSIGFLALLGCLAAALPLHLPGSVLHPFTSLTLMMLVLAIVGIYTYQKLAVERSGGITTPAALSLAYAAGVLIGLGRMVEGIALCFMTSLALAAKLSVEKLVNFVTYRELLPAFELGVIVFLLGPLLPLNYTDPFIRVVSVGSLYIFFVTVLTLSYAGYIAVKLKGTSAIDYIAFVGGLANSEATVVSSLKAGGEKIASRTTLLANTAMITRNFLVFSLLALTQGWLDRTPLLVGFLAFSASIAAAYILSRFTYVNSEELTLELQPLSYSLAARATALFALALLLSALATLTMGEFGIISASLVGGLVSSSTIVFSSLSLAAGGYITFRAAVAAVLISTAVAVLNKMFYAGVLLGWKRSIKIAVKQCTVSTPLLAAALLMLL